jgi:hypothetical protein
MDITCRCCRDVNIIEKIISGEYSLILPNEYVISHLEWKKKQTGRMCWGRSYKHPLKTKKGPIDY